MILSARIIYEDSIVYSSTVTIVNKVFSVKYNIENKTYLVRIGIRNGLNGKSAYQSYLDTTTDNPPLTEAQWIASFTPDPNTVIDPDYVHTDNNYTDADAAAVAALGTASTYDAEDFVPTTPEVDTDIEDTDVFIKKNTLGVWKNITWSSITSKLRAFFGLDLLKGIPPSEVGYYSYSYDAITRIMTIIISQDTYYYVKGVRYTKAAGSYALPAHTNTDGVYFVYYNNVGALTIGLVNESWDLLSTAQIMNFYYNQNNDGNGPAILPFYELHDTTLTAGAHKRLHHVDGTKLISGGAISGETIQTDTTAAVTWQMEAAHFVDENIYLDTDIQLESNYTICWFGANGSFNWRTGQALPYLVGPNNRMYYNPVGQGLVEVPNTQNMYYNNYTLLVNGWSSANRVMVLLGQNQYTSSDLAILNGLSELSLSGIPIQEMVLLYQRIYRCGVGYSTTTGKVRLEVEPIKLGIGINQLIGASSTHNALAGRSEPDAHPISSITGLEDALNNINTATASSTITQVSHNLSVGDAVRYNGTAYIKAIADTNANAEVIGIVTEVITADSFILTTSGLINTLSGLVAGTVYFLSPTTAGLLTDVEPTTNGQISKPLLIATSTTGGYLYNFRGFQISPALHPLLKSASIAVADWNETANSNGLHEAIVTDDDIIDNVIVEFFPVDNSNIQIWESANIYPGAGSIGSFKLEAENIPTGAIYINYTIEEVQI